MPGELATPGYLYVVHKGVALYAGVHAHVHGHVHAYS